MNDADNAFESALQEMFEKELTQIKQIVYSKIAEKLSADEQGVHTWCLMNSSDDDDAYVPKTKEDIIRSNEGGTTVIQWKEAVGAPDRSSSPEASAEEEEEEEEAATIKKNSDKLNQKIADNAKQSSSSSDEEDAAPDSVKAKKPKNQEKKKLTPEEKNTLDRNRKHIIIDSDDVEPWLKDTEKPDDTLDEHVIKRYLDKINIKNAEYHYLKDIVNKIRLSKRHINTAEYKTFVTDPANSMIKQTTPPYSTDALPYIQTILTRANEVGQKDVMIGFVKKTLNDQTNEEISEDALKKTKTYFRKYAAEQAEIIFEQNKKKLKNFKKSKSTLNIPKFLQPYLKKRREIIAEIETAIAKGLENFKAPI